MLRSLLRSSPLAATLISWLRGTRYRVRGPGHQITTRNARLDHTTIEIAGRNCRLSLGTGAYLRNCSIKLEGDGAELHVGDNCRLRNARLVSEDNGSRLVIGHKTSMTGPTLVSEEGGLVQLGRDCMIAQHAEVRNSDSHSILDGTTGARLNPAADVVVGDHVWIGLGACVFKGARIGDGAIIAARALVTGAIPPASLAVGTPAKVVRQGIAWRRERSPGPVAHPSVTA